MNHELKKLRKEIDDLDQELLSVIHKRTQIITKVGLFKKSERLDVEDMSRDKEVVEKFRLAGSDLGLDEHFTELLSGLIINESKRIQEEL